MGLTELALIMFVALVLFGPEDLPVIARAIGRVVFQVRKLMNEVTREFQQAIDTPGNVIEELLKDPPAKAAAPAAPKAEEPEELLTYETEDKPSEPVEKPASVSPLADLPSEIVSYSNDKQAGE